MRKVLMALSVTALFSLSASAESVIFFASGDVVFARSSGALRRSRAGDAVIFGKYRSGSAFQETGRGRVFRWRDEHVAMRVESGRAGEGDAVLHAGEGGPAAERVAFTRMIGRATGESLSKSNSVPRRILVLGISGAPEFYREEFDERARQEAEEAARNIGASVLFEPASEKGLPSASARRVADVAVVPLYQPGLLHDSLLFKILDLATGREIAAEQSAVELFPGMNHQMLDRRVGDLRLLGRYSGLRPFPRAAGFDREGNPVILLGADAVRLSEGLASYAPGLIPSESSRSVPLGRGELTLSIERSEEPEWMGLERVAVRKGDALLYSSGYFPEIRSVASWGEKRFLILREGVVEVLEWSPVPAGS